MIDEARPAAGALGVDQDTCGPVMFDSSDDARFFLGVPLDRWRDARDRPSV
jgi:hypothetical protein